MAKPKTLPYDAAEADGPYSVKLHNTAGGSDKIYEISIEKSGGGWLVNYANGRRGSTMATGTKTQAPVPYAEARKIANGVLYDKVGGGYVPIAGSRFGAGMTAEAIATQAREASGHVPQLLLAITDAEIERYIKDDGWVGEPKHDGERRFLIKKNGEVTGGNRKGQTVALSSAILKAAESLDGDVVLDGEQIGDRFVYWDIISRNGIDLKDKPWYDREAEMVSGEFNRGETIHMTVTARTASSKRKLVDDIRAAGGEGVVFKRRDAKYDPGKPGSGASWVKYKFWQSLSAVVSEVGNKRSVGLELYDDGKALAVGNVTVPANQQIPKKGDIVEVRYLYAFPDGGSLFQPTLLGKRADLDKDDCTADQRVFKQADAPAPKAMA